MKKNSKPMERSTATPIAFAGAPETILSAGSRSTSRITANEQKLLSQGDLLGADDIEYIENTEIFTIATAGYRLFTLNLCASMRRAGTGNQLVVYTPDRGLYDDLIS